MFSVPVFRFLLVSFLVQLVWVGDAKCPPSFNCGNLGNKIQFPFTTSDRPDCGLLVIHGCDDDEDPNAKKTIKYSDTWFDVVEIDQFTITIRDDYLHDLLLSNRCSVFTYTLPFLTNTDFASYHLKDNVTIFACNSTVNLKPIESLYYNYRFVDCSEEIFYAFCESCDDYTFSRSLNACKRVQLPTKNTWAVDNPFALLSDNITISILLSPPCESCHYVHGGQWQHYFRFDGVPGIIYCLNVVATSPDGILLII